MSAKPISRTWAGLGAAVITLLALAQTQLGDLELQPLVKWLLIFSIGALVALITAYGGAHAACRATQEEEEALQAALAGNVVHVSDRNPFDLGASPGPAAYVARPEDIVLDEALAVDAKGNEAMVLLTGPPGAGKTRSAYEAILRTHPHAMLLAPVDGPAVNTILAQREKLGLDASKRAVLWLDSLERYFGKLDLDALDELLFPAETASAAQGRIRRVGRRAWRASRRWLSATPRRRKSPFASERDTHRQVAVVATIRDAELKSALEGDDAVAQTARRLTARMHTVPVAPMQANVPAHSNSAIFEPTAFHKPPAPTDGVGLLAILGALFIALVAGLWIAKENEGWKVPPSLTSQVEHVEDELESCQHPGESPAAKELRENSSWILAVSNKDCPGSDTVRYFAVSKKRLEEKFSESPASSDRWEFICLAPGKQLSCRTPVPGLGDVTLGAFRDANKGLQLPLVLYKSAGETRLYAPFLSPPMRRVGQGGGGAQVMTLKLHPGAAYSPEPNAPKTSCQRPAQLCSHALEFLTALPRPGSPPLLIIGTITVGSVTNPEYISLRAAAVEQAMKSARMDPRECLFYRDGTRVSSKREMKVRDIAATATEQVRDYWTARPAKKEAVVC